MPDAKAVNQKKSPRRGRGRSRTVAIEIRCLDGSTHTLRVDERRYLRMFDLADGLGFSVEELTARTLADLARRRTAIGRLARQILKGKGGAN